MSSSATAPEWLRTVAEPDWFARYGSRIENFNLPKTEAGRAQLASVICVDGRKLLNAINSADAPLGLAALPTVQLLERVWEEQFNEDGGGQPGLRDIGQMPPPAKLISSPYGPEVRYSTKRGNSWAGYKVHLTESCDEQTPRLITNVETTPATTPDDNMSEIVHRSLGRRDLLPSEHLVDKGYTDAKVLVRSQVEHGIAIVGPVAQDPSWQTRNNTGFDKSAFAVDWEARAFSL